MNKKVIWALTSVQVLFGIWHVVGSAVLKHIPPEALIGYRVFGALPILFWMARIRHTELPSGRTLSNLIALGLLIIPGNQLLYANGLALAGPVNASVLLLLAPVFTLLFVLVRKQESFSWARTLGIGLALIGALGLAKLDQFEVDPKTTTGNLILMCAAFCYAMYLGGAKPAFEKTGFFPGVFWVFLFGGLAAAPWTVPAMTEIPWTSLPVNVWWMLLFVILGPTIGTYALNAFALEHAPSSLVGAFITLQPVVAISLTLLFLEIPIEWTTLLWGIPVVAGVLLCSFSASGKPPRGSASRQEEAL